MKSKGFPCQASPQGILVRSIMNTKDKWHGHHLMVANLAVKSQLPSLFSGSLFVLSVAWTISNKKLLNKIILTIALAISSQSQSLSTRGNYFARCLRWGKGCYTEKGTESHCVTDPGWPSREMLNLWYKSGTLSLATRLYIRAPCGANKFLCGDGK